MTADNSENCDMVVEKEVAYPPFRSYGEMEMWGNAWSCQLWLKWHHVVNVEGHAYGSKYGSIHVSVTTEANVCPSWRVVDFICAHRLDSLSAEHEWIRQLVAKC